MTQYGIELTQRMDNDNNNIINMNMLLLELVPHNVRYQQPMHRE